MCLKKSHRVRICTHVLVGLYSTNLQAIYIIKANTPENYLFTAQNVCKLFRAYVKKVVRDLCIQITHTQTPLLPATLPPNKRFDGIAKEGLLLSSTLRTGSSFVYASTHSSFIPQEELRLSIWHAAQQGPQVGERGHYQSRTRRYYKLSRVFSFKRANQQTQLSGLTDLTTMWRSYAHRRSPCSQDRPRNTLYLNRRPYRRRCP